MITIQLKGIIEYYDGDNVGINIIDDDRKINLVYEFEEYVQKYGNEVQINYWITDKPCTKDEMLEGWLKKVFGAIEAEYESYYTGSWTYGAQSSWGEYENRGRIKIGGHDLFDELQEADKKFIIMELNFKQ